MELCYGIIFMKRILGMPGTSQEPHGIPGIPCARPWDPRGRPWDPQERSWDPKDLQGILTNNKNGHISTNIQRQQLSIAVFEAAYWCPSHEQLDRAVFSIKRLPKLKQHPPVTGISQSRVRLGPYPCGVLIYKDIYP